MRELVENVVKRNEISVQIVPLTEDCVEAVKKLEVESNLSPWSVDDYKKEIERPESIAMVAKNDREIIGFFVARLITIQDNKNHSKDLNEIELYNIAVKSKFRNRGIAQALLDQLLTVAARQKVSKIWLEVRESNGAAIQFYKKNGFRSSYTRKNFYSSPPENAVVMELDLSTGDEICPDRDRIYDKLD